MASKNELLLTLMKRVDASAENAVLSEVIAVWLALLGKFSPLIGPSSVQVLFLRSLDANRARFPWFPPIPQDIVAAMPFSEFEDVLKSRQADEVVRATHAMLDTYLESLFRLIGATLTAKFVQSTFRDDAGQ